MRRKEVFAGVALLLAGLVAGAVLVGQFGFSHNGMAETAPGAPAIAAQTGNGASANDALTQLNDLFVKVAEEANPSVVTIFTQKVVRTRQSSPFASPFFDNPWREFFGDDFFQRFFGPQQPRGERYIRGMGSGVIVSEKGYILTNNHVVRDADEVKVMLLGGKRLEAEVVGTDAKTDLAVLRVKADGLKPIKLGDSDKLRVGEWVLAIGSPLSANLDHTVTAGIVSAKGRSNVGLADYEDFIQTDAAINPGNSGGALINLKGELVGINTAIATETGGFQGIGFAVPINMARKVMEQLIEHGKVIRGWLGVQIQDITEDLARSFNLPSTEGALVAQVVEDSPAEKAGLQVQDVILEIDGKKVKNTVELREEVAGRAPGTKVKLKILRDGKERTIEVVLGEFPESETPARRKRAENTYEKLGFSVTNLTPNLAQQFGFDPDERGVVVTRVRPGSNAYEAGLNTGALIKRINRKKINNINDFNDAVADIKSGDTVLLYVKYRNGSVFIAFEAE